MRDGWADERVIYDDRTRRRQQVPVSWSYLSCRSAENVVVKDRPRQAAARAAGIIEVIGCGVSNDVVNPIV
jgi:hypothetical protein